MRVFCVSIDVNADPHLHGAHNVLDLHLVLGGVERVKVAHHVLEEAHAEQCVGARVLPGR